MRRFCSVSAEHRYSMIHIRHSISSHAHSTHTTIQPRTSYSSTHMCFPMVSRRHANAIQPANHPSIIHHPVSLPHLSSISCSKSLLHFLKPNTLTHHQTQLPPRDLQQSPSVRVPNTASTPYSTPTCTSPCSGCSKSVRPTRGRSRVSGRSVRSSVR